MPAEAGPETAEVMVVYSDLDGTMVGPGGNFFRTAEGDPTLQPAAALVELHVAAVPLVLVSGRSYSSMREAADIFGADGFIGELGGIIGRGRGRSVEVMRGAMPDELEGTPAEAMRAGRVLELLTDRWPGQLQLHDPWHEDHQVDLLLRGNVPVDAANALLAENGWGWIRLHDNGFSPPGLTYTGLDVERIHYFHLIPDGITKDIAVRADLERRGLLPENAIAIGDSVSDLAMAPYVGTFFLVANGVRSGPLPDNVVITRDPVGVGWSDAIRYAVAHAPAP